MASVTDEKFAGPIDQSTSSAPRPMIVAENAHVEYRVHASGKRANARESLLSLSALRGGRQLKTVSALRGVSFTASEGETIGVVGHNGSGKSTLFRAMSGLIPTSEGTILARERPVLLGVNAALVPELSGEDNIKIGLLAMGYSVEEAAASVDEIADFAELNEFIYHPMRTYSSGMGARLRFAIASAKAHSILLVDEALSVGDRRFKVKSDARIRALRDSAGLVMIVSHSISSIKDTCERVLWIHKGELIADGPSSDVVADYVQWTKKPGGAVGAASISHATRVSPRKSAQEKSAAVKSAQISDSAVEGPAAKSAGLSELQHMIAAAEESGATRTPTQPIPERTLARRDRYRRTTRKRTQRRLIAIGITAIAILLAVGAGAAIALLTRAPAPSSVERPATASSPASSPFRAPAIASFAAATPTVVCALPEGETPVELAWQVDGARTVAIASGSAALDAIESPMQADLPALSSEYLTTFPCTAESQTYTLTAEGLDGSRTNAVVTLTRELAPQVDVDPDAPITPVQPAPQPPPVEPSESPVEPSESPVEPSESPVEPSESPVEPSESPVEPSESPVEPSESPVEPSESPVEPNQGADPVASLEPTEP